MQALHSVKLSPYRGALLALAMSIPAVFGCGASSVSPTAGPARPEILADLAPSASAPAMAVEEPQPSEPEAGNLDEPVAVQPSEEAPEEMAEAAPDASPQLSQGEELGQISQAADSVRTVRSATTAVATDGTLISEETAEYAWPNRVRSRLINRAPPPEGAPPIPPVWERVMVNGNVYVRPEGGEWQITPLEGPGFGWVLDWKTIFFTDDPNQLTRGDVQGADDPCQIYALTADPVTVSACFGVADHLMRWFEVRDPTVTARTVFSDYGAPISIEAPATS